MDENTRKEIRKIAAETLRDAELTEPPLSVERLLEHVQRVNIDSEFDAAGGAHRRQGISQHLVQGRRAGRLQLKMEAVVALESKDRGLRGTGVDQPRRGT